MPIETVPEHDIRYHLVAFDAKGRERPEEGGPYSRAVLREAATSEPTDVFLFSHGWNGDVPDARRQYGRWLAAMASCGEDIAAAAAMPGGFRPLLVGLHWPSKAWGDEQLGGASFLVEATGEGTDGDDAGDDARDDVQALVSDLAAQLHDTPATRQAIRTIVQSALVDAAPATLPSEVRKAYQVIDADTGTGQEGAGAARGISARAAPQPCSGACRRPRRPLASTSWATASAASSRRRPSRARASGPPGGRSTRSRWCRARCRCGRSARASRAVPTCPGTSTRSWPAAWWTGPLWSRHPSWRGRARGVAGGGGHLRRCRPRWRGFPTICGSLGSGSAHEVRTIRARLR